MKKAKKLVLSRETLRELDGGPLRAAVGGDTILGWGCTVVSCLTCGDNSCVSVCTLNCGGVGGCRADAAQIAAQ